MYSFSRKCFQLSRHHRCLVFERVRQNVVTLSCTMSVAKEVEVPRVSPSGRPLPRHQSYFLCYTRQLFWLFTFSIFYLPMLRHRRQRSRFLSLLSSSSSIRCIVAISSLVTCTDAAASNNFGASRLPYVGSSPPQQQHFQPWVSSGCTHQYREGESSKGALGIVFWIGSCHCSLVGTYLFPKNSCVCMINRSFGVNANEPF
jgi:hypothetical protein